MKRDSEQIMKSGSGLGAKLLLAFLVVLALPAAAGLASWFEMRAVVQSHNRVTSETLPALADVRGFTGASARIVAVAPELAAVADEQKRRERASWLLAQTDLMNTQLTRYRRTDPEAAEALDRAVRDLRAAIAVLDLVVQRRLLAAASLRARVATGLAAASELSEIADTLVANAEAGATALIASLSEIEGQGEAQSETRLQALDRLIEADLFQLSLMSELRRNASELGLLLNRLAALPSDGSDALLQVREIGSDMEHRLRVTGRRVAAIADPGRAARAMSLLTPIRTGLSDPSSGSHRTAEDVTDVSAAVIALSDRVALAEATVISAARQLDQSAADLAASVQERAQATGDALRAALDRTRLLQLWGAAGALLISLAIIWFYIRGNITRRLDRLALSMDRLAQGETGPSVPARGQDEIAGMEAAVEVFRRQALENRALEAERQRHLAELDQHRTELQNLVEARTRALREEVEAHDVARLRAEAADRAKSEFLAMMSHEIRTPMNGVQGMLRSLPREGLTPLQRERLGALEQSSDRLMVILTDILDFLRAESGPEAIRRDSFDPVRLIRDAEWLLAPAAAAKGLRFDVTGLDHLPPWLCGDPGRLRQILINLLSNAIKFTETGRIHLAAEARPAAPGSFGLSLTVRDTGRGIAPEAQRRIFEPFEQESRGEGRWSGGTGLGLAIARRFALAMGGRLTLESSPDQGSVFSLTLTLPEGEPPQPHRAVPLAGQTSSRPLALLVVEDHPINCMVIEASLAPMGHRLEMVSTAETALSLLMQQDFDAVLMDVNLPGISGTEATRRIRALPDPAKAQIPVIGVSAHLAGARVTENLAAGMTMMVPKPLSPESLSAALLEVTGRVGADPLAPALADLAPEVVADLAGLYLSRLPGAEAGIAAAAAAQDHKALSRAAHQLASATGNFRLPELLSLLQEIETAALAGRLAGPDLAELPRQIEAARQRITAALQRIQSSLAVNR